MQADEIIVLEQGRITERGDHDALLAEGGVYKSIYDIQMAARRGSCRARRVGAGRSVNRHGTI